MTEIRELLEASMKDTQVGAMALYCRATERMQHEMTVGKMAGLAEIVAMFKEQHPAYCLGQAECREDAAGVYMLALCDCIALCSEQLYEHYRALMDMLRAAVACAMKTEGCASPAIAYALVRGSALGVLNGEKYLPIAEEMLERAQAEDALVQAAKSELMQAKKG